VRPPNRGHRQCRRPRERSPQAPASPTRPGPKAKALAATGDDTIRTSVYDVVNGRTWPRGYTGRVVENRFVSKWHGYEADLARARTEELEKVREAATSGDFETANVTVGEAIGLLHDIPTCRSSARDLAGNADG
jgi:nitronate monooxygenase